MPLCFYKSKCCIYSLLIGHILINGSFLAVLLLSCYDIKILKPYQKIYLIISIITWIIIIISSIMKLFLIIFGKFSQAFYPKTIWLLTNIPAFLIIGIALIYDFFKVTSSSGIPGLFMYYFFTVIILTLIIISSIKDFCGIQSQIDISQHKVNIVSLQEENDITNSKKIN